MITQQFPLAVASGVVKSVSTKFGFVITSNAQEAIFSPNECPLAIGLKPGDAVDFYLQHTEKGKRAFDVRPQPKAKHFGYVRSYNTSKFGIIVTTEGQEALFHPMDIIPGQIIQPGDAVEFDIFETQKGKHATGVGKYGFGGSVFFSPPSAAGGFLPSSSFSPLLAHQPAIFASPHPQVAVQYQTLSHSLPPSSLSAFVTDGSPRQTGTVKSYNHMKGYGFIVDSEGSDVMVSRQDIIDPNVILQPKDIVEFVLQVTPKGKRATSVQVAQATPVNFTNKEFGTVKSFSALKGFGFVITNAGDEAMVVKKCIIGADFLNVNDTVEFEIEKTEKGKRAIKVRKIDVRFKPY